MNPAQLALMQLQKKPLTGLPNPSSDTSNANDISEQQSQESPETKALAQGIAQSPTNQPPVQQSTGSVDYSQLKSKGYSPTQIENYLSQNPGVTLKNAPKDWAAGITQSTIIPKPAPLTETFGQIQPGVEVFSHGVTTGTGIGVSKGTPLATPPGDWKVVSTYDTAPQKGYIGNGAGDGWGNNVVVQNQQTGESLRYSHLSEVGVAPGDTIKGNQLIGLSGQSGNTTGDHLNIQYITPQGQPADILQSQYAPYLPIKSD